MEVSGQPHQRANNPPVPTEYEPGWAPQPVWTFFRKDKFLACVRRRRRQESDGGLRLVQPLLASRYCVSPEGRAAVSLRVHSSDICVRWQPDPNVSNELAALILQAGTAPLKAQHSI